MSQTMRVSPGDATGQEKRRLQKEAQQTQRDRSAEMSLASAIDADEAEHGVFDPQSGEKIGDDGHGPGQPAYTVVDDDDEAEFPESSFSFNPRSEEPVFTGKETDEEMAPHLASAPQGQVPQRPRVQNAFVKVRIAADIEDMTYGMTASGEPNNYNFKEGYTYRVPLEVAEHLNERNLIAQWIG
jgi:hypothetical protein